MDNLEEAKTKLLADHIERFLEPKPQFDGFFWSPYTLASYIMDKMRELEIADFEREHEKALEDASRNQPEFPF